MIKRCKANCKYFKTPECPVPLVGRYCSSYALDMSMPRDIFLRLSSGEITEPKAWDLTEERL